MLVHDQRGGRVWLWIVALALAGPLSCRTPAFPTSEAVAPFTVAVIPDTQNYVDYTHQEAAGFALDASELFIEQMRWVASRSRARGGDIAFVAHVGDVWQHQSKMIDQAHVARGVGRVENPLLAGHFDPAPEVHDVEIPKAIEGYRLISEAGLAFGIAPGNHDYDAMWSVATPPPEPGKEYREVAGADVIGSLHIGGLDNFRTAFGDQTDFFRDRDWYVSSFGGGANSAQLFHAGGYRFLHFALEMQPGDAVLAWVESVLEKHPGLPTIVTTHDYLTRLGDRVPNTVLDLAAVDPSHHNSAEDLYRKLIARNDQIFLVLCGHQAGQALRVDQNEAGHEVYQILSDYQDRGQVGIEAGQPPSPFMGGTPAPIGDGWLRLLEFHLASTSPKIVVRTYSTHYAKHASELASYAEWYREHEQPEMTDAEFLAAEQYEIPLVDFRARFGAPRAPSP